MQTGCMMLDIHNFRTYIILKDTETWKELEKYGKITFKIAEHPNFGLKEEVGVGGGGRVVVMVVVVVKRW